VSRPNHPGFTLDGLEIDAAAVTEQIAGCIRDQVQKRLRRRGVVLGLSGGIDSSVVAALCVRALGPEHVFGLFTPEWDSDPDSLRLGRLVAEQLGMASALEDIGPILDAAGCYRRRDEFIRQVFPEYGPGYKSKIVLPNMLTNPGYNVYSLVIQSPSGEQKRARLPLPLSLGIIAATNMKQRTRKQIEYYHADRLNYVVAGTPNLLEHDQGFFVKNGDGAADIKPIAHLYKCQVYKLADYLGVPAEIRGRPSTTDTYSLEQSQEEFFFSLPLHKLDRCLYAFNHDVPAEAAAPVIGLTAGEVWRVYKDIQAKRRNAHYLHQAPLLVEPAADAAA